MRALSSIVPVVVGLLLTSCVFAQGEPVEFDERVALDGVDTVRVQLPDTEVRVGGVVTEEGATPELHWAGRWIGYGGTSDVARDHASAVFLEAQRVGRTVRLSPRIPAEAQGLVGLELDGIEMPAEADLELRAAIGPIRVEDISGAVSITTTGGDVEATTTGPGLDVYTDAGFVEATSVGYLEVYSGFGNLVLEQLGPEEDVLARTDVGSIDLVVPADGKFSYQIEAREIRVDTPLVTTVTTGFYERQTDVDGPLIHLAAPNGEVVVRTP